MKQKKLKMNWLLPTAISVNQQYVSSKTDKFSKIFVSYRVNNLSPDFIMLYFFAIHKGIDTASVTSATKIDRYILFLDRMIIKRKVQLPILNN